MHKDLVYSISDDEFKSIVKTSSSYNEIGRKLGFKHSPGARSKGRIKGRMNKLSISILQNEPTIKNINELVRYVNYNFSDTKLKDIASKCSNLYNFYKEIGLPSITEELTLEFNKYLSNKLNISFNNQLSYTRN